MLFRRRKNSDFEAEVAAHLELEAERLVADGMDLKSARAEARRRFGNVGQAKERFHEAGGWQWGAELWQDLRYGARGLWSAKAFTAAAILTIALGVGANAGVFRLVDQVLLRVLPVEKPDELVFVAGKGTRKESSGPGPYPYFNLLREKSTSFANMAVSAGDSLRIEIDGQAESVPGQVASGTYFETLGVKPTLGRLLTIEDEKLSPPVTVISHEYWHSRFGGSREVLGRQIHIKGKGFQIVGVMEAGFRGLQPGGKISVTFPITMETEMLVNSETFWLHDLVGRLRPGVSRQRAEAEVDALWQGFLPQAKLPQSMLAAEYRTMTLKEAGKGHGGLRSRFGLPLYAMSAIAGLVLLTSVVNIANLLLARGLGRKQEFAIRMATGAGRLRLARQVLAETVLLYSLGFVPGLLLADWGTRIVAAAMAEGRRGVTIEAGVDLRVILFAFAATLTFGILASLFPMWQVFRRNAAEVIAEGGTRSSESRGTISLRQALVAGQVAVALVLLTGAFAFTRSLEELRHVDLGFGHPEILTMSIDVSSARFRAGGMSALWNSVLESTQTIPGVRHASISAYAPMSGRNRGRMPLIAGFQPNKLDATPINVNSVSAGFFETLGIRLLAGRSIEGSDSAKSPAVAVLNEEAARYYYRNGDALGKEIRFKKGEKDSTEPFRIVGIVGNTKHTSLKEENKRIVYLPFAQAGQEERRITLLVAGQAAGQESLLVDSLRKRIREIERQAMVSEIHTVQAQIDETLLAERLLAGISMSFGALSLALAGVGMFGVLSFRVAQERRANGIRMALGAQPRWVAMRVLKQSLVMVGSGILIGLPVAYAATRSAWPILFGIEKTDASLYVMGAGAIASIGIVGALWPAWKAASVSPQESLRG